MSEDVPPQEVPDQAEGDDDEVITPGYKAPEKVSLETLKNLDADDESLVKYKQSLLAGAENVLDEGGSNVLVKALHLEPEGHDPIVLDLTGDLSKLKGKVLTLKEGCHYKVVIKFRVQREIVAGLRYFQQTYRKGIKVDKSNLMVGSYGPKSEVQEFKTPQEDAPSGLMHRGTYTMKSKFTDDDKNIYLEWEWSLAIKKDWE